MRHSVLVLLLAFPLAACPPTLRSGDDDDTTDDDDTDGDDDDTTDDDDTPPPGPTDDDDVGDDDDVPPPDDDDTPPEPISGDIGYGYYFGECGGACRADLVIDASSEVSLTVSDWNGDVYYTGASTLSGDGTGELLSTFLELDVDTLQEVYGCPDCADGGGEYVTFPIEDGTWRSDYEHSNPPPELIGLDAVMDGIVAELIACDFDFWVLPFPDCESL